MSLRIVAVALIAALAAAAGCERPPQREPQPGDTALRDAIQAPQDRARAVEAEVKAAKDRADREIEEQGG